MNNEYNNLNTGPVVEPTTQPINDKFMPVSDINQINQQPVVPNTEPAVVPTVMQQPVTEPVFQAPIVEPTLGPTPESNTEPQPVPSVGPQLVPDSNTMVNENLKKVEIKPYTPPSKFKIFVLLVLFILIVVFIIFLPDISSMISLYTSGAYNKQVEKITTGRLVCTLDTNTEDLDKDYEFAFTFDNSKLKRIKYIATTKGDSTTESSLEEIAEKCNNIKKETNEIEGFYIRCDYSDGQLVETQNWTLETLDEEKLGSAFAEAGGILPTYEYDQNIDEIETNMKVSGYSCVREK